MSRREIRGGARCEPPGVENPQEPVRIVLIGTDFEVRVWETLLKIPMNCATTYSDIARALGKPKAARASMEHNLEWFGKYVFGETETQTAR